MSQENSKLRVPGLGLLLQLTELLVQPFVVIFHLSSVLTEHS